MPDTNCAKLRILLVDDNADHIFLTRRELQSHLTCEVLSAQSGADALRLIAQVQSENALPLDVILLDNGLPDMSGLDVLSLLRQRENLTPVIIMTGQGSEAIAVEAMRRGASDYIVKAGTGGGIVAAVVEQVVEREKMRSRNEQLESEHVRFARLAAIGEVAAGIAHEIRNPMTVISGMASLLRDNLDRLPPDQLRECARAIADNCTHLNRVLDEVLTNPQAHGARTPMLLADLVDETLAFMRFDRAFRHRVIVERDYHTRGLVVANRDELKQVFINLFRNAAQALQMAGKEQGTLRIAIEENEDGQVVASVQDEGPGIAPEAFSHLFESGFTTKTDGIVKGTGLGLGICRRIIEAHGGKLEAAPPQAGEGATFCLALPRCEEIHNPKPETGTQTTEYRRRRAELEVNTVEG